MIKKDIFQNNIKDRFKSAARDKIHRFLMADDQIKGAIVHASTMVREMQANHELDPLGTLILGQAYIGAALMCSSLKGHDRLSLSLECSGPVKGLHVDANTRGEIRGYLQNAHICMESADKPSRLSQVFGAGFLTVTKYLGNPQKAYTGQVMLEHGNLAKDIANYYLTSEQIPTAIALSVAFDENEQITGAGGIFLQALPGAHETKIDQAQTLLSSVDCLGQSLAYGYSDKNLDQTGNPDEDAPQTLIQTLFSPLYPRFLDHSRVEFFCRCSHEGMAAHLHHLPLEERKDILANDPFPLEIRCHHCNSLYHITKEELEKGLP